MIDDDAISQLRAEFTRAVAGVRTERELQALRDRYVGRRGGAVTALWSGIASASPDEKRRLGRLANELKAWVEEELSARQKLLAQRRATAEALDVTLPGRERALGHPHPLTAVLERVESIFLRWGYQILDGPESEDDYHNFEALNMPPEHPARDMQDTLYLAEPLTRRLWSAGAAPGASGPATLLRTHTSAMQIRYMESHRPPVRIVAPGRVYRRDSIDVTHTPMFTQIEGLVVGDGITMADLKGTLTAFLRELFTPDTRVLLRPSFFPYTEPSAEVLIGCVTCGGSGCQVCKRTGWLEILGCGMVHPAVFEAVGYDSERYTGFAFGMGIERVAMLKYGIDDIRLFYENDLRFLEQFPA